MFWRLSVVCAEVERGCAQIEYMSDTDSHAPLKSATSNRVATVGRITGFLPPQNHAGTKEHDRFHQSLHELKL